VLGRLDGAAPGPWRAQVCEAGFRKGELLQRQGEPLARLQVVKVGLLLVQRGGPGDGAPRPVGLAGCGQVLGTPALLQQPADLSYVAVAPGRVCRLAWPGAGAALPAGLLQGLLREQLHTSARLADWGRIARLRGVAGQLAGALVLLAELQRSTLVRLPSHTVLAALLGTTRESVARALAQLAREHALVRRDRWHCEIERTRLLALSRGGGDGPGGTTTDTGAGGGVAAAERTRAGAETENAGAARLRVAPG